MANAALQVDPIPQCLRDREQWVCWKSIGRGVKLFLRASKPAFAKCRRDGFGPDGQGGLELDDRARFFVVTGRTLPDVPTEVASRQMEIEALAKNPIPIPDEAIGQRKVWRELGELVRNSDEPLHLVDFAKYIRTADLSHAAYHVRLAEKAGLISKIGHYGGWVAAD